MNFVSANIKAKLWSAFVIGSLLLVACSHGRRFTPRPADHLTIRRMIRMEGVDLVDNLNQWNLKADIANLYPGAIIFYMSEVKCYKGEVEGHLDIKYFPLDAMHFKRGQVRKIAFRCQFPSQQQGAGEYKIVIPRIFHNPLDDGETTDNLAAEQVIWKIKPSHDI